MDGFGRFRRLSQTIGVAIVIVFIFSAGAAYVALGSTTGETYYACVNNASGTIKMVDESTTCSGNEVRIVWNQQGPQGEQGIPGQQGDKGDPGDLGVPKGAATAFVRTTTQAIPRQTTQDVTVSCDWEAGERAVAGHVVRWYLSNTLTETLSQGFLEVWVGFERVNGGWTATIRNNDGVAREVTVAALCYR
jgi:hypothetical protein